MRASIIFLACRHQLVVIETTQAVPASEIKSGYSRLPLEAPSQISCARGVESPTTRPAHRKIKKKLTITLIFLVFYPVVDHLFYIFYTGDNSPTRSDPPDPGGQKARRTVL